MIPLPETGTLLYHSYSNVTRKGDFSKEILIFYGKNSKLLKIY
jgi:hypothetical protein